MSGGLPLGGAGPTQADPAPTLAASAAGAVPGELDRLRRRALWSLPGGIYVLGSRAGEELNLMTLSWAMQVATEPRLVAVSIECTALTHRLVTQGAVFSVCTIARVDRASVRRFVKPVVHDRAGGGHGTLNGFTFKVATTGAPILDAAVAWLDCRVRDAIHAPSHSLFVGEVVDAGFNAAEDTAVLRMEDTRMSYGG